MAPPAESMRAACLVAPGRIELREVPRPSPSNEQVLIKVEACGACRTDLHLSDGELKGRDKVFEADFEGGG